MKTLLSLLMLLALLALFAQIVLSLGSFAGNRVAQKQRLSSPQPVSRSSMLQGVESARVSDRMHYSAGSPK